MNQELISAKGVLEEIESTDVGETESPSFKATRSG